MRTINILHNFVRFHNCREVLNEKAVRCMIANTLKMDKMEYSK